MGGYACPLSVCVCVWGVSYKLQSCSLLLLLPIQAEITVTKPSRVIALTALAPGHHTLSIRAGDKHGNIDPHPRVVSTVQQAATLRFVAWGLGGLLRGPAHLLCVCLPLLLLLLLLLLLNITMMDPLFTQLQLQLSLLSFIPLRLPSLSDELGNLAFCRE